jgi:hypothetical protein
MPREDRTVIVVVEGPSAAGKTTWCRQHTDAFISEYAPRGQEPTDPDARARYWARQDSRRWAAALERERRQGLAVCDTDPVKLHYTWSMVAIGLQPRAQFDRELAVIREAFAASALGLADVVLVALPDADTLRRQRAADRTRTRRKFDTHLRLREPLAEWYRAVDRLDPGRVIWELPAAGLPDQLPPRRADRSAVHLLDDLIAALPPV